jgi:hypothetical protein
MPTYLGGKNATVTIAGQVMSVTGGTLDEQVDKDDISNTQSGGFKESFLTLKMLSLSGIEVVYDGATVPTWGAGSQVSASITIPGGPSISIPALNVMKVSHKFVDPNGALRFSFDAETSGAYTFALG